MSTHSLLSRLRTLALSGDLEAAAALHAEASRRDLSADRELAGRVLFAGGRGRVDHAAMTRDLADRHGDPPYRLTEVHASDAFVAVVEGHEGYRSGHVVARLVLETLRECLEPDHTFDPEAVYAERDDHWRPLSRVAAAVARPATLPDALADRLHAALVLAERRMQAWDDHHPQWQTTYGAQVEVAAFDLPRAVLAHIGLGQALHWRAGALRSLTQRHDIASRWQGSGLMTPGEQYDWTLMPDRMLSSVSPRDDDGQHTRRQVQWVELELAWGDALILLNDPQRLELTDAALRALVEPAATSAAHRVERVLDHVAQTPNMGRQAGIAVVEAIA